jgi:hypothetical protein
MALWGLPMDVVAGAATGASASFFTLVELDNESALARGLFGSRLKAVVTSTGCALAVGYLVNPLAGITFELMFYPACWLKSRQIRRTLEKLARENPPGSEHMVQTDDGEWSKVRIAERPTVNLSEYRLQLS